MHPFPSTGKLLTPFIIHHPLSPYPFHCQLQSVNYMPTDGHDVVSPDSTPQDASIAHQLRFLVWTHKFRIQNAGNDHVALAAI